MDFWHGNNNYFWLVLEAAFCLLLYILVPIGKSWLVLYVKGREGLSLLPSFLVSSALSVAAS